MPDSISTKAAAVFAKSAFDGPDLSVLIVELRGFSCILINSSEPAKLSSDSELVLRQVGVTYFWK